jgi:hypothetical protein
VAGTAHQPVERWIPIGWCQWNGDLADALQAALGTAMTLMTPKPPDPTLQ